MYILSREEMQALDRATIDNLGIPGAILMEHAGKNCAAWLDSEVLEPMSAVALMCGTGNNGGDGYVVARWLRIWGHLPVVFDVGDLEKMSPETAVNRQASINLGVRHVAVTEDAIPDLLGYELVVDALFGVGFRGELTDWRALVVDAINDSEAPVAAIDIPSGVDANTGAAESAVLADWTLTMAYPKYGCFVGDGLYCAGEVIPIDIGMPPQLAAQFEIRGELVTEPILPIRDPFAHKGDCGRVGVLAGSPGFAGAARMATHAALRAGAGLVTLYHPAGMEAQLSSLRDEVMTFALTGDDKTFLARLERMDVVLAGCGMGVDDFAVHRLDLVIDHYDGPLVLDADALTILSRKPKLLKKLAERPVVLTPHHGEFARLCGVDVDDITRAPLQSLLQYSGDHGVGVLLKGPTTVYARDQRLLFNIAGNDAQATGGSGDVLAGVIAGFIAQGLELGEAAIGAAHLLGRTAEHLATQRETHAILPTDILENMMLIQEG